MKVKKEKTRPRKFTASDDEYIRNNIETSSYPAIAKVLGRTADTVYRRAKLLGLKKYHWSGLTKDGIPITREREASICWRCKNAVPDEDGNGCSWSKKFQPVDGWTAVSKPVNLIIKGKRVPMESYNVRSCPQFVEG